jgi:hypothetical protein
MGEKFDLMQTGASPDLLSKDLHMAKTFPSGFEVAPFSDLDYEGMAVEIRYQGVPVAELNRDKGLEACEVVIPSRFSPVEASFTFPLNEFLEALNAAKSLIATLS